MTDKYNSRENFIEAITNLWKPIMELNMAWEKLSTEDNGETSVDYPFIGSFDEWVFGYATWVDKLTEKFSLKTTHFNPTLTVKELKNILDVLDEDIQIVVRDEKNDWWLNIESVEMPNEDEGSFTLTFNTKNNFDNRQF